MARRLSPEQLQSFKKLIQRKRVIEIGDEASPFLAAEFARFSKSWISVGRAAPELPFELSPNLTVVTDAFGNWQDRPDSSEFDVIVLAEPSSSLSYDVETLAWAHAENIIVFFGDATEDHASGSPDFWDQVMMMHMERNDRDRWSRCIVFRKQARANVAASDTPTLFNPSKLSSEKTQAHNHDDAFPRKGERYRLASTVRWPGKKPGERPPVIEIANSWTKSSGPVKMVGRGDLLILKKCELANPL